MNERFETLGNATIQVFQDSRPVLATDPWLVGECYFGSWALDHPLTADQIANVVNSDYIWISHGHPDHLHHQSLDLLPKGKAMLVPDHYDPEIKLFLTEKGFNVVVLRYRQWFEISSNVQVMCIDNINQDAVLVIRVGDALVININDAPVVGELAFLRGLVRRHPNHKTYLLALCSVDADMFNFVDDKGDSIVGPPDERKPGAIWAVARLADLIGVKNFCCSSSQHIYVRADSIWANSHRITWADIQRYWSRPSVRPIQPFVTIDVATEEVTPNHPSQKPDERQITGRTGEDDWDAALSSDEWASVEAFFGRFDLLKRHLDFVEVSVAGETRHFDLKPKGAGSRGIRFHVPKQSLLETVRWGFFDDLLIGNFMKVHLINTRLYPRFTPIVAKLGGNAKVYTRSQHFKFLMRYFRRNPLGTLQYLLEPEKNHVLMPWLRERAEVLGVKKPLKYLYRSMRGDPVVAVLPTGGGALPTPPQDRVVKIPADRKPVLIVVIDTEENFDWRAPYSPSSVAVHGMREIETLQRIFDRFHIRPIYMVDYAVADQRDGFGPLLDIVTDKRCEIGAHLHPWVNPPITEEICVRNTYPCNLPRELEREKLRVLTSKIESNFGVRPEVYKAGRYGIGASTPNILIEQKYKVDLSVVPTRDYSAEGGPDFRDFKVDPFWIDADRRLLEIPFTASFTGALHSGGSSLFRGMNSHIGRSFHLPGAFARLGLLNRVNLTPEGVTLGEAKALTWRLMDNGVRVFTLAFHSTSLTPGSTPYVGSIAGRDAFYRWLEDYFTFFMEEVGGDPMTPLEFFDVSRGQSADARSMERPRPSVATLGRSA